MRSGRIGAAGLLLAMSFLSGCQMSAGRSEAASGKLDPAPVLEYLGNLISRSPLEEELAIELRESLAEVETHTAAGVQATLETVRQACDHHLARLLEGQEPDDLEITEEVAWLVEILTVTEVIGAGMGIELLGDTTHRDHRCERRAGDIQKQCYSKSGYNCRNTRWGCITVKR